MNEQEFVIVMLAIIFGSAVAIVFIVQLFGLIKSFLNRKGEDQEPVEINEQLIEDYLAFKKQTEQRIQKLEKKHGISSPPSTAKAKLNTPHEENSLQDDDRNYSSGNNNKLKNMLRK